MCGRYRLSRRKQLIAEYFETDNEVDWEPRYNIAPSQPVGIIRQDPSTPERHFSLARWGLIPSWATDASIGFKTINARAETVASKPAFRDAFVSRRCLLPADGFFEWRRSGKEKQPFHFGMQDDSLFAFAGLWDRWRDPTGTVIESCSILTTTPNSLLADVHDRMPVILRQENYDLWLDPGFKDVKALAEVLAPFDAAQMRSFPVSTRINAVANDDPDCVAPMPDCQPTSQVRYPAERRTCSGLARPAIGQRLILDGPASPSRRTLLWFVTDRSLPARMRNYPPSFGTYFKKSSN